MHARLVVLDDVDLGLEREWAEWSQIEGLRLSRELPGYRGVMTLVDRDNRLVVRIHLLDGEAKAREADATLNGPPPGSMPEVLKRSIPTRSLVGVFDVVERDSV